MSSSIFEVNFKQEMKELKLSGLTFEKYRSGAKKVVLVHIDVF